MKQLATERDFQDHLTFYDWLKARRERKGHIGDLARDAVGDSRFPRRFASVDALVEYLAKRGACDGVIEAARKSWVAWYIATARVAAIVQFVDAGSRLAALAEVERMHEVDQTP